MSHDETVYSRKGLLPRAPRVSLLPLHEVKFHMSSPVESGGILVANLSASGAGFIRASARSWPPEQSILRGNLELAGKSIPVVLKVIHNSPGIVGCSFEGESTQLKKILDTSFGVDLLAMKLEEVPAKLQKGMSEGKARQFRGNENCDLYFVEDTTGVAVFRLSLLGNVIECGENGNATLLGGEKIPLDTGIQAIRFIENIPALTPNQKSAIASVIERAISGKNT